MAFDAILVYKAIPVILIVFTFISLFYLLRTITDLLTKTEACIAALLITLLYLQIMPSLSNGIYWYTGAVTYQTAIILTLIYCNFLTQYHQQNFLVNKSIHIPLIILLAIAIVGCNETALLYLLLLHSILFLFYRSKWMNIFFAIAITASLFVIISPGNDARSIQFINTHQLFYSLKMSVLQCARFAVTWISSPALFIASLLLAPYLIRSANQLNKKDKYLLLKTVIVLLLLIFASAFPAYWYMGMLGQHRTVNVACFFFIPVWFLLWMFFLKKYSNQKIVSDIIGASHKYRLLLFLLFIVASVFSRNGFLVSSDLYNGTAKNYNQEITERNKIFELARANNSALCEVDSLKNIPQSIYNFDITANENDWMNRGTAAYFGINKVRIGGKHK